MVQCAYTCRSTQAVGRPLELLVCPRSHRTQCPKPLPHISPHVHQEMCLLQQASRHLRYTLWERHSVKMKVMLLQETFSIAEWLNSLVTTVAVHKILSAMNCIMDSLIHKTYFFSQKKNLTLKAINFEGLCENVPLNCTCIWDYHTKLCHVLWNNYMYMYAEISSTV